MTIYRIAAPDVDKASPIALIGVRSPVQPAPTVLIFGVGYTDREGNALWARRRGYQVDEVDTVPDHYKAQCARLEDWPVHPALGSPTTDGADPDSRFNYPSPDGRTVDVRDILNGTLTK